MIHQSLIPTNQQVFLERRVWERRECKRSHKSPEVTPGKAPARRVHLGRAVEEFVPRRAARGSGFKAPRGEAMKTSGLARRRGILERSRNDRRSRRNLGYKHPLLLEIFSELRFAQGTLPHGRVIEMVSALGKKVPGSVEFGQLLVPGGPQPPNIAPTVRHWSDDRKVLFQFSQDLVVLNQVQQYKGWDAFLVLFRTLRGVLEDAFGKQLPVSSLSLNTIDRLEIRQTEFRLGEYLNCDGTLIPSCYSDAQEPFDIVMGRGVVAVNGRNRQIRLAGRREQAVFAVQMEVHLERSVASASAMAATLEELHTESTDLFESMITAKTRAFMEGSTP